MPKGRLAPTRTAPQFAPGGKEILDSFFTATEEFIGTMPSLVVSGQRLPNPSRVTGKQPMFNYVLDVDGGQPRQISRGVLRFSNENPEWVR